MTDSKHTTGNVYFVRHNDTKSGNGKAEYTCPEALMELYKEKRITLFWDFANEDVVYNRSGSDGYKVNENYNSPVGSKIDKNYEKNYKNALRRLAEIANEGGLVVAEYNSGRVKTGTEEFYGAMVGEVANKSKIEPYITNVLGKKVSYGTTIKVKNCKVFEYSKCWAMLAARPQQSTICRTHTRFFTNIIPAIYRGKKPNLEVGNLHYKMIEQMCVEFLRKEGIKTADGRTIKLDYCTLRPGKSMPVIDIAGVSDKGGRILAQVKFSKIENDDKKRFIVEANKNLKGLNIIFSRDATKYENGVSYKKIEEIFTHFEKNGYVGMLKEMMGDFAL